MRQITFNSMLNQNEIIVRSTTQHFTTLWSNRKLVRKGKEPGAQRRAIYAERTQLSVSKGSLRSFNALFYEAVMENSGEL